MEAIPSFPLYEQLLNLVKESKTTYNIKKTIPLITPFTDESLEIIDAIILHHYLIETKGTAKITIDPKNKSRSCVLPYNGRTMGESGKGIIYQLSGFPPLLQDILCELIQRLPFS